MTIKKLDKAKESFLIYVAAIKCVYFAYFDNGFNFGDIFP